MVKSMIEAKQATRTAAAEATPLMMMTMIPTARRRTTEAKTTLKTARKPRGNVTLNRTPTIAPPQKREGAQ